MLKGKKMVKHLDLQHAYKSSSSIDVIFQFLAKFVVVFIACFGCPSLPSATVVQERLCFHRCLSVHRRGEVYTP